MTIASAITGLKNLTDAEYLAQEYVGATELTLVSLSYVLGLKRASKAEIKRLTLNAEKMLIICDLYRESVTWGSLSFPKFPLVKGLLDSAGERKGPTLTLEIRAALNLWVAKQRSVETAKPEIVCSEGGTCVFTPDLEYDASGRTLNCEKCGEPKPRKKKA